MSCGSIAARCCAPSLRFAALLAQGATATEVVSPDEAERRQLTVMFCNLVGAATLGAAEPQDMAGVIASCRACMPEVVGRYHGMIARHMGEGVFAYICYSHAQEDDAEQSVRAALALVDAGESPAGSRRRVAGSRRHCDRHRHRGGASRQ